MEFDDDAAVIGRSSGAVGKQVVTSLRVNRSRSAESLHAFKPTEGEGASKDRVHLDLVG